jgi:pilus assembly protein Flp/PilA
MKFIRNVRRFLQDEQGPTAVEYAVMLALVLLAVISAINAVGSSTSAMWQQDANKINSAQGGAS